MTPKKPDWFELTEGNDAYAGIKKINKKLPLTTLVVAGAVILGGSIFATANNEPSAVAETPTASQSLATSQPSAAHSAIVSHSATAPVAVTSKSTSGVNSLPIPTVTNFAQRGDDDEHEGREGGEREHKERDHEDRDDD
jgi:hypothetical protein